jgi:hypothetical protein
MLVIYGEGKEAVIKRLEIIVKGFSKDGVVGFFLSCPVTTVTCPAF